MTEHDFPGWTITVHICCAQLCCILTQLTQLRLKYSTALDRDVRSMLLHSLLVSVAKDRKLGRKCAKAITQRTEKISNDDGSV